MIIDQEKLIFVHIAKTGGNAVSLALGQSIEHPTKHHTAAQLRVAAGGAKWNADFKFGFVRNPWDRLVSWWSMIDQLRPAFDAGASLNSFQTMVLRNTRDFTDFVRLEASVVDTDGTKSVQRSQKEYLSDTSGNLIVDFVGRFERLENDLNAALADRIGRRLDLKRVNASKHAHYSTYYSSELAEEVGRRCRQDIEAFGYRFERQ